MTDLLPLVQLPGRNHVLGSATPEGDVRYFIVETTLDEILTDRLRSKQLALHCTAARDLFAGTAEAGTVILKCHLALHNDSRAHAMARADGRTVTWR